MMRSYADIDAELTAAGQFFEIEDAVVRGVPTRVWKNTPRCLRDVLEQGRAIGGDRTFIVHGDQRISHEEHFRWVVRLANKLVDEFGVAKGDRVAIAMRNYPEWSVAFFASTLVGAVAVPLNAFWTGSELEFGIADSGSKVLIADGERLERLGEHHASLGAVAVVGTHLDDRRGTAELPNGIVELGALLCDAHDGSLPRVAIEPDDDATIFYTSGTTSRPKGVCGTHRNICSNLISLMYVGARNAWRAQTALASSSSLTQAASNMSPPVSLLPVPLFHATGCHSILVAYAYFGATIVLMRKWNVESALDLIEREGITVVSAVPTMVWEIINSPTLHQRDLSRLVNLGGGGAAAPPELLRRILARLPGRTTSTGYGLTETSSLVASILGDDYVAHPDSVGVPVPVCQVRIVDECGADVPHGERGEIWINGPNVVPGYWRRPDDTAATFTAGWLHSGDIGRVDDEGFLYIVDRAKYIIIRGGENISSAEVEAAVYEHPEVVEAAAIGVTHPVLGEEVGVVVCVRDAGGLGVDELRDHVAARLAAFKVPTRIWIVTEPLPRNPAGKVLKRELRNRFGTERSATPGAAAHHRSRNGG
jgi:long-chain acyl-CoA synthetase